jgi:hypothetical protein
MTPADTAAAQAVLAREPDQGVAMTYAASGSRGITVADNDNIDFGTGNFTLCWKGSLPDWTDANAPVLMTKTGGTAYALYSTAGGKSQLTMLGVVYISTVANTFIDKTSHEIVCVVTRESASVAGSVVFYADGILFGSPISIPAGVPTTVTNADTLYISGSATVRSTSTTHHAYTFNRALTAAEVLDLYRSGIAFADKWGSQTPIYTSDFSAGVDSWTNEVNVTHSGNVDGVSDGVTSKDDVLRVTVDATLGEHVERKTLTLEIGKQYLFAFTYYIPSGQSNVDGFVFSNGDAMIQSFKSTGSTPAVVGTWATASVSFTATATTTALRFYLADGDSTSFSDAGSDDLFYISILTYKKIGATLALEPGGFQPAPGQCLDSSSNKLHAMQPATGSSLARYKKDFEYRWTNTWTASSAAQYVGGLNQNVLSADHFITDIITQATVTTDVENLELGDGSAVAKFVAAFTPSATRTKQTVAAQNDGTNLKLVYTPAAEATMTVETIIRGFIWEP